MGEEYKTETVRLPSDEDFQTVSEEKRLCDVHFWNFCRKLKIVLSSLVGINGYSIRWIDERGSGRRPFYYSPAPDKLPDYTSIKKNVTKFLISKKSKKA